MLYLFILCALGLAKLRVQLMVLDHILVLDFLKKSGFKV